MPMVSITLSRAKGTLSEVLDRVQAGESFQITRNGKVAAVLVPVDDDRLHMALQKAVTGKQSEPEVATGLLRPAPDAAAAFPRDERRAAVELEVPASGPKTAQATMPVPEGYSDPSKQQIAQPAPVVARSPAPKPKPLTLADILRAQREP